MRCVTDELTLLVERLFKATQHRVEGNDHILYFVVRPFQFQACIEATRADFVRRASNVTQGAQCVSRKPVCSQPSKDSHKRQANQGCNLDLSEQPFPNRVYVTGGHRG